MLTTDDIQAIKFQFETQGFVHLRQIVRPALLARLNAAFDAAPRLSQAPAASEARPASGFHDIPAVLDYDDAFVDLVDMDSIVPVLVALVGDDIQLTQTAARLFYPGTTFTAPFHSDLAHVRGFSHEHSLNFLVKVHYYVEDLAPDQGCLAFIPGSHRWPAAYPRPASIQDEHGEGVVKIVPRAGDAVIFNTHVMHMALDNKSGRVRKSIIYSFSHFWMKQYRSAIPANLARFTCRQRKQLFGVDEADTPHFNRRLSDDAVSPYRQVVAGAKRVLRKLLRA